MADRSVHKEQVDFEGQVNMKTKVLGSAKAARKLGRTRVQQFEVSLVGVDGSVTPFSDNDILAYLGELDVSENSTPSDGINAATNIIIEKVVAKVTQAAGTVLLANLALGTAANEAVNGAVTGALEIVGAGAVYTDAQGGDAGLTEVDADLNAAAAVVIRPNISTTVDKKYLYIRTTTLLSALLAAGAGIIEVTYTVY